MILEEDVTRAQRAAARPGRRPARRRTPTRDATALVESIDAHQFDVLPLLVTDGALTVAIADPLDVNVMSLLRSLPVDEVHVALGVPTQLRNRVNRTYSALSAVRTDIEAFQASDIAIESTATIDAVVDAHADRPGRQQDRHAGAARPRLRRAHRARRRRACVRFRVDGALHEVVELPREMGDALVSRIKIMADMNIVERRRPQDGQFEMNIDDRDLDVRVSTTSTIWGEKTVLRLLDRTRSLYRLADLGMPADSGALYSRLVNSPYGMIIVGGPTGSGKTTTLYATLSEINRPDINVMTIEDPVEYIFPRVNQIQISEQAGMTFATGLKSILRQDPDVILVGEVRDVETARIAVQSALTGHRVFSSVHAIDAVSSLYRLLDMGIEPFLITSAIVGVVAQRLVRRICASCAVPFEPSMSDVTLYQKLGGRDKNVRGCAARAASSARAPATSTASASTRCSRSPTSSASAWSTAQPPRVARELAAQQGLRTLQNEAIRMVEADVTTMEEVVKHVVVGEDLE